MNIVILWTLVTAAVSTEVLNPSLPKQTPVQAQVLAQVAARAKAGYDAGVADLMTMLNSPYLKDVLTEFDDGSNLQALSADELFSRMKTELEVAELVHNFGSSSRCGGDVTLDSGPKISYLYSQWMLQVLGFTPIGDNDAIETSETNLLRFPPFASRTDPDAATAASRPVYSALNLYRGSEGNPVCGPITAILSRKAIGNDAPIAPMDTGMFFRMCGDGQTTGWFGFNCNSWTVPDGTIGLPDTVMHLLPSFVSFSKTTEAITEQYPIYNLGRLLTRLLSRKTYTQPSLGMSLNFPENIAGYLEVTPVVALPLPGSIKLLVAAHDVFAGTKEGIKLREWCIAQEWPLAWAHNPAVSNWDCSKRCKVPKSYYLSHGIEQANVRILDPTVLAAISAGRNATTDPDFPAAKELFDRFWHKAESNHASPRNRKHHQEDADALWAEMLGASLREITLLQSTLAVEPLYAGACSNSECAAVRIKDGACVCAVQTQD